jgi:hypothetical protein
MSCLRAARRRFEKFNQINDLQPSSAGGVFRQVRRISENGKSRDPQNQARAHRFDAGSMKCVIALLALRD